MEGRRELQQPVTLRREEVEIERRPVSGDIPAEKGRLNTCWNAAGQGLLVFVRSASDCGPRYLWVVDGEVGVYAVDSESQTITPDLPVLKGAPPDIIRKVGFTAVSPVIREAVCGTKND
jgi:hypothetical protein